jgi:hypothetical protein
MRLPCGKVRQSANEREWDGGALKRHWLEDAAAVAAKQLGGAVPCSLFPKP